MTELVATEPVHWGVFPFAMGLVCDFCRQFEPARDVHQFYAMLRDGWTKLDPHIGIFVVHGDDKSFFPLMGHMLLTVEKAIDGLYLHLWQAQIQPQYASDMSYDFMQAAVERAKMWGRERQLTRLEFISSRHKPTQHPFVRKYGFTIERMAFSMEID